MPNQARKTLVMLGAFCALAVGGSALAGAATKTKTTTTAGSAAASARPQPPDQQTLTGATADKVKAAALAKVPGASVLRVEAGGPGGPGGSAYHAHVRKSDGSEVVVLVNASFDATSVVEHPHP